MATPGLPNVSGAGTRTTWRLWVAVLALAGATVAAYHNTFLVPFVFDDIPAIAQNQTIRGLRWSSELLAPGALGGSGAAGRPLVNLSLALNRALGGDDVRGYHALNLLIHIAAGLVLFGLMRRTLARRLPANRADATGFMVALLWLLHPLQTESVTCVIQRTESLMGLFFLLTLYAFARATECHLLNDTSAEWRRVAWQGVSVSACLLGAATKEVMAVAPLIVLLYDRTFVAGSFREVWRRRGRLHLALASTSLLVAVLVWRSQARGGTVGFGHGITWWEYALTQCRAVVLYVKLALWPHPLVLDYGTDVVRRAGDVWPQALLLVAVLGATAWALVRRPLVGFLGAWFFVILAPSSSVVPLVTQTMAEHRMYLPLAAVAAGVVLVLRAVAQRAGFVICGALALALGVATERRNADYRTAESVWRDTAAKVPGNARAHFALAQLASDAGRTDEAIAHGATALRLRPGDAAAHFNLAFDLTRAGRLEEARAEYMEAARLRPGAASAHVNLAAVLVRLGRLDDAIAEAATVVRMQPASGEDRFNLAQLLARGGRLAEALPHAEAAARLLPKSADAHFRLGTVRARLGREADALPALREAVRLAPDHFEAHMNLAGVLLSLGRAGEAVPVYEAALRLRSGDQLARTNLAVARDLSGR